MPEKSTFKDVLPAVALSTIFSLTASIIMLGINKTDQAAPRDYVDRRFDEVKVELSRKAEKSDIDNINTTLRTIDSRVYDLWKSKELKTK